MIAAQDIRKCFGGVAALDGFSFRFDAGEIYGLVGPNGCGKTSFLNVLSGFYTPDQGVLSWEHGPASSDPAIDISRMPPWARAQMGIGRTFQEPRGFVEFDTATAIMLGQLPFDSDLLCGSGWRPMPKGDAMRRVEALLESCHIDFNANTNLTSLSYGQRKIIDSLAMLARKPKLVLLDEPFAGVDPGNAATIIEMVKQHVNNCGGCAIIVSHELALVRDCCTRMCAMENGRITITGAPDEVICRPEFRRLYLG